MTHIALLRGINVGGKHRLPMKPLVALFEAAGCTAVRHYIQSGNIVLEASAALARRVPETVGRSISEAFGFEVPILVRTLARFRAVVDGNPFAHERDPKKVSVGFLQSRPARSAVASLDPDRSPGDAFVVQGDTIYLHMPNGAASTRLTTPYLDSHLRTICTVRNWNTVCKILELAQRSR